MRESVTELSLNITDLIPPALSGHDASKLLFVDIETTGLSSKRAFIYMIGLIYLRDREWIFDGLFAETPREEEAVLLRFIDILKGHGLLIHYNGTRFDLPFITDRCKAWGIDLCLDEYDSLDIYRQIAPYKSMLGLSDCKQKSVEAYLGIAREDRYSGGELIQVYHSYATAPSDELYDLLYTHNHDDLTGMAGIMPILNITGLFEGDMDISEVCRYDYTDRLGECRSELIARLSIPASLPVPLHTNAGGCFLSASGHSAVLKIPVYHGELKFFYDNPKEYYYLPVEDIAVHKSVAVYVDREYRRQAVAADCYTRKTGDFLPQWDELITPSFKLSYSSKPLYFEFDDGFLADTDRLKRYIGHILMMIKKG